MRYSMFFVLNLRFSPIYPKITTCTPRKVGKRGVTTKPTMLIPPQMGKVEKPNHHSGGKHPVAKWQHGDPLGVQLTNPAELQEMV